MVLQGGCHCGSVRFEANEAPVRIALCHCGDCRRHAAAPVVGWALFKSESLTVAGSVTTYASSADGRRQFCPRCGTGLFYRNAREAPGRVDVQLAAFDDPNRLKPTVQVQAAERIAWMDELQNIPAVERFPAG